MTASPDEIRRFVDSLRAMADWYQSAHGLDMIADKSLKVEGLRGHAIVTLMHDQHDEESDPRERTDQAKQLAWTALGGVEL